MIIEELTIQGFRNFTSFRFLFHPKTNLLFGANGSGKTSVLESIYFLSFGKSFLNTERTHLINHQQNNFSIFASVRTKGSISEISSFYKRECSFNLNQKRVSLNEIKSVLFPVFFSSHTFSQILAHRYDFRRFIERFISGLDTLYLTQVLRYNRALKQKNLTLKSGENRNIINELLSWNSGLSEYSHYLMLKRKAFCDQLNIRLAEVYRDPIQLRYCPSIPLSYAMSTDAIFQYTQERFPNDIRFKMTTVGPHRDVFELYIADKPIHLYSSGEKKRYFLYVIIAFINLYSLKNGMFPVLLLDDWDSALDDQATQQLCESFPDMQVIATSVSKRGFFHQNHILDRSVVS